MKLVLVTGGKGQLASCIRDLATALNNFTFVYVDVDELDITKEDEVNQFFDQREIAYCINCAAFTAVDKAESQPDLARKLNVAGAKYLAQASKRHNAKVIQISTDFVFDGSQGKPYIETDGTNALGIYGSTKLIGEKAVMESLKEHFILRTSWLYSQYGNNFLTTMLRIGADSDELKVVDDQMGTPTYAGDLAQIILKIIDQDSEFYGLYHYSNEGVASWYDFAMAIMEESKTKCKVRPIKTERYPTLAKRPSFSVMDKSKIKKTFGSEIPYWRDSLKKCLSKLKRM